MLILRSYVKNSPAVLSPNFIDGKMQRERKHFGDTFDRTVRKIRPHGEFTRVQYFREYFSKSGFAMLSIKLLRDVQKDFYFNKNITDI